MMLWFVGLINLYFYFIYHNGINLWAFIFVMVMIIFADDKKNAQ